MPATGPPLSVPAIRPELFYSYFRNNRHASFSHPRHRPGSGDPRWLQQISRHPLLLQDDLASKRESP